MTSAPPPTSSDASATKRTFIIGTRQSKLALLQTNLVLAALKEANPHCSFDIHSRETAGDKNTNIAFREFTTKNLWTEELEELLIAGHVDFIVHSLKGMFLVLYFGTLLAVTLTHFCRQMCRPSFRRHVSWAP